MNSKTSDYRKPANFNNKEGEPRKVGFELEFGNLTVRETTDALQNRLGGRIRKNNPFCFEILDSSIGRLKIERDAEFLNSVKHREALGKINVDLPDTLVDEIESGVDRLSSFLIPCEIVTDPLAFQNFPKLNEIVNTLNALDAKGTQDSILYAFGLHLNPSVPDLEPETLAAYLQSFLLLSDWIIEDSGVDFSRRFFTSFIDPFPQPYVERMLDANAKHTPDMKAFIDDYLEFNPTRNRGLDLLPVLCEIDMDRVIAGVVEEERSLVGNRPAFHYRLPDCRIGDANWSIANQWNYWWYVEAIASDNDLRSELIRLRSKNISRHFFFRKTWWVDIVGSFLAENINTPEQTDS